MLTMLLMYIKAFAVGGLFCLIGEILILKTKLTPARILVCYITAGVILSAVGLYGPIAQFAGAGATVPLTGFGHVLSPDAFYADYSYLRLSITRLALPSLRASEPAGHSLTVACTRQEADNCAAT